MGARFAGRTRVAVIFSALLASGPFDASAQATTVEAGPGEVVSASAVGRTVDRLFSPYDESGGPGAIVAVLRHGEIVHLRGYGYANREFRARWTPQTLYTFYSTTKPMLAIALLRLEESGRIDLDAPVRHYLREFPAYAKDPTVRDLLQHTSGIWQDEVLHFLLGVGASNEEIGLDELYGLALRQPALSFRPGSGWYYNDAGTRIAARVLTTVTGKSFEAAMRELVLAPAGMATTVHRPRSTTFRPGQASTYLLSGIPRADLSTADLTVPFLAVETSGDGGLLGTIRDYVAFARFAAAPRSGGSYLSRLARPVLYGPGIAGPYRTSWVVNSHRGLEVQSHGGLFGKRIAYVPELDAWILIMSNAIGAEHGSRDSHFEILDALLAEDGSHGGRLADEAAGTLGTFGLPPEQSYSDEEFDALTGVFLEPRSRSVLAIERDGPHLRHRYLSGDAGYVVREEGGFRSWIHDPGYGEPLRLRAGPGRVEANVADWGEYRALLRVDAGFAPPPEVLDAIAGTYLSDAFGSIYRVEQSDGGLRLRINAGARLADVYALTPLAPGVFEATQLGAGRAGVVFQLAIKDPRGAAAALVVNAPGVRGLELRRVATP